MKSHSVSQNSLIRFRSLCLVFIMRCRGMMSFIDLHGVLLNHNFTTASLALSIVQAPESLSVYPDSLYGCLLQ